MPDKLVAPRYCQLCGRFLIERFVESEGRPRYQCEGCGFVHYMNPRVVASVIVEHDGRLLLQDGNHRFEALWRAGAETAWVLVYFDDPDARDRYLASVG